MPLAVVESSESEAVTCITDDPDGGQTGVCEDLKEVNLSKVSKTQMLT